MKNALGVSKVQEDHHRTLEGAGRFEPQRQVSRSLYLIFEDELRRRGHRRHSSECVEPRGVWRPA